MCDCKFNIKKEVLNSIIEIGIDCNIDKIILFGSRARGDFKEKSDIDIAVYGEKCGKFAMDLEEKCPTLLKFDIVDLKKPVAYELLNSIEKEGVVLYEKI